MINNNTQIDNHSTAHSNASTPTIVVSPNVAPSFTPGGTREWLATCPNELKPTIGMTFNNVEEGFEFYKAYAFAAGFNTRKSTTKRHKQSNLLTIQYIVCNKEGYKEKKRRVVDKNLNNNEEENAEEKALITRKILVTRVGCKAHISLNRCGDKFMLTKFHEGHNHPLYTPSCNHFQKEGRKINILHKKIIVDNSKVTFFNLITFHELDSDYNSNT